MSLSLTKRTACPIFILLAGVRRSVFIFGSDTTHRLRKTICRKFPCPDMDPVYTQNLVDYLTSLVPGVKAVDKQNRFFNDTLLDALGPISQLFEHIFGILLQCKPGDTIDLTHEQVFIGQYVSFTVTRETKSCHRVPRSLWH